MESTNSIQLTDQFNALERSISDIYNAITIFLKTTKKKDQDSKNSNPLHAKYLAGHIFDKLTHFELIIDELYIQIDVYKQELILKREEEPQVQAQYLQDFVSMLEEVLKKKNTIVSDFETELKKNHISTTW